MINQFSKNAYAIFYFKGITLLSLNSQLISSTVLKKQRRLRARACSK